MSGLNWGCILEKATWLETPFEEDEVRKAIFECSKEKALGPNSFNFAFFLIVVGRWLKKNC